MKLNAEAIKGLWGKLWFKALAVLIILALLAGVGIAGGVLIAFISTKARAEVIQRQPIELAQLSPEEIDERRRAKVIYQLEQERVFRANQPTNIGYEQLKLVEMMTDTTDLSQDEKAKLAQILRDYGRDISTTNKKEAIEAYQKAHELSPRPEDAELIRLLSEYKNGVNAS